MTANPGPELRSEHVPAGPPTVSLHRYHHTISSIIDPRPAWRSWRSWRSFGEKASSRNGAQSGLVRTYAPKRDDLDSGCFSVNQTFVTAIDALGDRDIYLSLRMIIPFSYICLIYVHLCWAVVRRSPNMCFPSIHISNRLAMYTYRRRAHRATSHCRCRPRGRTHKMRACPKHSPDSKNSLGR